MSMQALRWAWQQETRSPGERLVILFLADSANKDRACWPSVAVMKKQTGIGLRQIKDALRGLKERGLIAPMGRKGRRIIYHVLCTSGTTTRVRQRNQYVGNNLPRKVHQRNHDLVHQRNHYVSPPTEGETKPQYKPPGRAPEEKLADRNVISSKKRKGSVVVVVEGATAPNTETQKKRGVAGLVPSDVRLARWMQGYVPAHANRELNRYGLVQPLAAGEPGMTGVRRLIRKHGRTFVLEALHAALDYEGSTRIWRIQVKNPGNYIGWYLNGQRSGRRKRP